MRDRFTRVLVLATACLFSYTDTTRSGTQNVYRMEPLHHQYPRKILPLLIRYCQECHQGDTAEAEVDLSQFETVDQIRQDLDTWLRIREMLDTRQMPPKDALQPTAAERTMLQKWVRDVLAFEARSRSGDPGPIVLRRLNNEEYNYTIGDLTGIMTLRPTREFPIDGAAGEGFINTGAAQAMSPSLVSKYLDAGKQIAEHTVLLPDRITFSEFTSERDRTDAFMKRIQEFYQPYVASMDTDGQPAWVNFQQESRFPFEKYLEATIRERTDLQQRKITLDEVASRYRLNKQYLRRLYHELSTPSDQDSLVLDQIRTRWQSTEAGDLNTLAAEIDKWQSRLFQFNPIGHIGRAGGPRAWLTDISPVTVQQNFEIQLPMVPFGESITVQLITSDAGDGTDSDWVLWQNPRLVGNGANIPLHRVMGLADRIAELRQVMLKKTGQFLQAAAEVMTAGPNELRPDLKTLAVKHDVDASSLAVWLDYLGVGVGEFVPITAYLTNKIEKSGNYDFVKGWGRPETPIVLANQSDQTVRIPWIAKPRSLMVHPSPSLFAAAGWRSPVYGMVTIDALVEDAHPECGNGQEWFLQHRTIRGVNTLDQGKLGPAGRATVPTIELDLNKGDLISLIVGPNEGNHACDLTEINLIVTEIENQQRVWDMASEMSLNIHLSNPIDDIHGYEKTWHIYEGEMASLDTEPKQTLSIPSGSLLERWKSEKDLDRKASLAEQIQRLVLSESPKPGQSADAKLVRQIHALKVDLGDVTTLSGIRSDERFGIHPDQKQVKPEDLYVAAPSTTSVSIPAQLAEGRTLVVSGRLAPNHGAEGSVQLDVKLGNGELNQAESSNGPIVLTEGSKASKRIHAAFHDFRQLFPPSLCYGQIVPVDRVVTLTLFFREDHRLQQLMLNDQQRATLDKMWKELLYVSREPLKYEVAFEQIREFATQDRPDLVKEWAPLVEGVTARAERFRKQMIRDEPTHLQSVNTIADRAWRRPLTAVEKEQFGDLYRQLRNNGLEHPESIRQLLTRVFTSPAFLYRLESPPQGQEAAPVSDLELATRLSFFLWSSLPDDELRNVADKGLLVVSETEPHAHQELTRQTHRMLADSRIRRLAIQFACQWLHLRNFDRNDDKNEKLYPEFHLLRASMYEETVQFFSDLFQNDGSILEMINADYSFLNSSLARHYEIPLSTDTDSKTDQRWQRVNGVQSRGRGGILGMASFLASQSGASRTSPILRGNWIYETLLGERLPRPPANVPQLPEAVPDGRTARKLIEEHTRAAACAQCHDKIDPYGFALEQYDAIGRKRIPYVDTSTKLSDGTELSGIDGLRDYLINTRREDLVEQFCKKLLGYSLGRAVQLSDEPLLDKMQRQLAKNNYRFSVAVVIIVTSPQFREIRGLAATD